MSDGDDLWVPLELCINLVYRANAQVISRNYQIVVNSNITVDELRQAVHYEGRRKYDDYTTLPSDIWFGACRATMHGECGDMRITDDSFLGPQVSQHRGVIAYVHPLEPPAPQVNR